MQTHITTLDHSKKKPTGARGERPPGGQLTEWLRNSQENLAISDSARVSDRAAGNSSTINAGTNQ